MIRITPNTLGTSIAFLAILVLYSLHILLEMILTKALSQQFISMFVCQLMVHLLPGIKYLMNITHKKSRGAVGR